MFHHLVSIYTHPWPVQEWVGFWMDLAALGRAAIHLHCLGPAKGLKPWPRANYRCSGLRRGQLSVFGHQLAGDELNPAGPILCANCLCLDHPPRRECCLPFPALGMRLGTGIRCRAELWVGFEQPRAANTRISAFLPGTAALQAQGAPLPCPSSVLGDLAGCLVNTAGKSASYLPWGERTPL